MDKTFFANPHGLPNLMNVSSANDLLKLCRHACLNPWFKEIMGCREYLAGICFAVRF